MGGLQIRNIPGGCKGACQRLPVLRGIAIVQLIPTPLATRIAHPHPSPPPDIPQHFPWLFLFRTVPGRVSSVRGTVLSGPRNIPPDPTSWRPISHVGTGPKFRRFLSGNRKWPCKGQNLSGILEQASESSNFSPRCVKQHIRIAEVTEKALHGL